MSNENPYASPESDISVPVSAGNEPYATRWQRFAGAFIDGLVLAPVNFLVMKFMITPKVVDPAWTEQIMKEKGPLEGMQAVMDASKPAMGQSLIATIIVFAVYLAINYNFLKNGQTIGKKLLKTQIQARNGGLLPVQTLITKRILPLQFGMQIAGLFSPALMAIIALADCLAIFRKDYNTLHDDIAGSKVVQI